MDFPRKSNTFIINFAFTKRKYRKKHYTEKVMYIKNTYESETKSLGSPEMRKKAFL